MPHHPRLVTDDMAVLREAAIAGVGVVQLPTMPVWQDVDAGRLVRVVPDWQPDAGIVACGVSVSARIAPVGARLPGFFDA